MKETDEKILNDKHKNEKNIVNFQLIFLDLLEKIEENTRKV